jgi:hypothetical protein
MQRGFCHGLLASYVSAAAAKAFTRWLAPRYKKPSLANSVRSSPVPFT